MRLVSVTIFIIVLTCFMSCNRDQQRPSVEAMPEEVFTVADFNADSAFEYVRAQVAFGPRVPNTDPHKQCATYLENTLRRFTRHVKVQSFSVRAYDNTLLSLKNIIASFHPEKSGRVILCAHWDSRPYADNDPDPVNRKKPIDGANDGASGVGVLLEIARQLSIKMPTIGVDILLLDGEDYGAPEDANSEINDDWALGAQYWSKNPHSPGYTARYGILLDMVGAADAVFTRESVSMYYALKTLNNVWNIAAKLGYSDFFSMEVTPAVTDDHFYINKNRNIPTIDIIQHDPLSRSGFYSNWHTTKDNMDYIDRRTLKMIGQVVLTTVYQEQ